VKVLLFHEMSGVHTELKKGLLAIGIDARIATFGDGWKSYTTDISLGNLNGLFNGAVSKTIHQARLIQQISSFDVVQSVSPTPFFRPINRAFIDLMADKGCRIFYLAAGSDAIYRKHVRDFPYFPPHDWYENDKEYSRLDYLLRRSSGIIPVCYEYEYCMRKDNRNPHETIPFPVDISAHIPSKLATGVKLKVFHPLNRLDPNNDFKGSRAIKSVFERLSSKYSDAAEFIISGGLPYQEYDRITNEVDIIVDQTNSMSYGMSAAYGLAKGKVVISGLEEATKSIAHYRECPIINVQPDPCDLEQKLEALLINRSRIRELGEKSRSFAEKFHDHKKVAEVFAGIYEK
jgi:hypothetical protein